MLSLNRAMAASTQIAWLSARAIVFAKASRCFISIPIRASTATLALRNVPSRQFFEEDMPSPSTGALRGTQCRNGGDLSADN